MQKFLPSSIIIDFHHPKVAAKAQQLAITCADSSNSQDIAKVCFEYVLDEFKHSADIGTPSNSYTA